MKKRDFIKIGGLAAGAVIAGCTNSTAARASGAGIIRKKGSGVLKLSYRPYELQLKTCLHGGNQLKDDHSGGSDND
ncbi:MAG: hypothetical protein MZV63_21420 [Marinilabiliales bacterium]|nr:hypothetical protein [Marinilabiliales bacterium]